VEHSTVDDALGILQTKLDLLAAGEQQIKTTSNIDAHGVPATIAPHEQGIATGGADIHAAVAAATAAAADRLQLACSAGSEGMRRNSL